ncbi:sensor histidine kinase [Aquabacterium sp. J223]|uniref:sensor histidine kinase n=1 Tax=Aquabacterium sp. J223 TaxID=2898431 RepID=UPI0021ADFB7C|nr:sensor histidine kinase [Aquabacterium sp. J223]UUX96883.1 sensor histidine kinase [Aquabacterium sp. J223]
MTPPAPTPAGGPAPGQRPADLANGRSHSLRRRLLVGLIVPMALFVAVDTVSVYRNALQAITLAYDRTLLTTARTLGEWLQWRDGRLLADLPPSALEELEPDSLRGVAWRITGLDGELLAGHAGLPPYPGPMPQRSAYPALVDFYDTDYQGRPVRVAALYQPVVGPDVRGIAVIQVAEGLDLRRQRAQELLRATLLRQALLVLVVAGVTWAVVAHSLKPVEALRAALARRRGDDLSPLEPTALPRELRPVPAAINDLLGRLGGTLERQQQFIRDASHQLRTPLTVLRTQLRNALDGDGDRPADRAALVDMQRTVERAIGLAQQMLALAKVDQVSRRAFAAVRLDEQVREVALDLAPLAAQKSVDLELRAERPVTVLGHEWMLRELARNLLHNALRETPAGGAVLLQVDVDDGQARLQVIDSGPGIDPALAEHLFEPFRTGRPTEGTGLGLTICRDICAALGGRLALDNRQDEAGRVRGATATVRLPAAAGG